MCVCVCGCKGQSRRRGRPGRHGWSRQHAPNNADGRRSCCQLLPAAAASRPKRLSSPTVSWPTGRSGRRAAAAAWLGQRRRKGPHFISTMSISGAPRPTPGCKPYSVPAKRLCAVDKRGELGTHGCLLLHVGGSGGGGRGSSGVWRGQSIREAACLALQAQGRRQQAHNGCRRRMEGTQAGRPGKAGVARTVKARRVGAGGDGLRLVGARQVQPAVAAAAAACSGGAESC